MPAFPIVDTHVHLWDPAALPIPWVEKVPQLKRPHLVAEFDAARGPVAVDAMVFLEVGAAPAARLDEARWVAGIAAAEPRLKGMVAAAPLENGTAVEDHLAQLAEHEILRGIRRLIQDEPDVAFCVRPTMSQKSSLVQSAKSVSWALTSDSPRSPAPPPRHALRGYARPGMLSVSRRLARKDSNHGLHGGGRRRRASGPLGAWLCGP